jgi:hypothetical protein
MRKKFITTHKIFWLVELEKCHMTFCGGPVKQSNMASSGPASLSPLLFQLRPGLLHPRLLGRPLSCPQPVGPSIKHPLLYPPAPLPLLFYSPF